MIKKHLFVYLFAALAMGGVFTSCGDDNDDPIVNPEVKPEPKPEPEVVCPIAETTFTGKNGLTLSYSGQPMLGKVVKFTPDASNATKATLVLSGDNFSLLTAETAIAGVVPGELTTTLNVDLTIDGEKVSFQGKDENEGRVIEYKGEATKTSLILDLDVTMPTNDLTGKTFSLIAKNPLTIVWDAEPMNIPIFTEPYSIENLLKMVLGFAKVEDKPLPEYLLTVFNQVSFLSDGNIQAKYKNKVADEESKTSPLNVATYAVKGDKILVYVNPIQIQSMKTKAGIAEVLPVLLKSVNEMLANGIPVTYNAKEGKLEVYLDETTLLPLLKTVKPLFEDEETVKLLTGLIAKNAGEMAGLVSVIVPSVLNSLPNVIDTTNDIHLGINLEEVK